MLEEERKKQKYGIKVHVIAKAQFDVVKEGKLVDQPSFHFPVKSVTLLRDQNIYDKIAPIFTTLDKRIQDRKDRGSGFRFGKLLHMDVCFCLCSGVFLFVKLCVFVCAVVCFCLCGCVFLFVRLCIFVCAVVCVVVCAVLGFCFCGLGFCLCSCVFLFVWLWVFCLCGWVFLFVW